MKSPRYATARLAALITLVPALALASCRSTSGPQGGADSEAASEPQVELALLPGGMIASYPDERTVVLQRDFSVGTDSVFAANTREDLLKGWYPPVGWNLTRSEVDLRPGGTFRNEMRDGGEGVFVIYGEFREVEVPTLVVYTESYEGYDWDPLDVTVELVPTGEASCRMTCTVVHPSAEIQALNAPMMVPAAAETFERMETFLVRLLEDGN